jgi:hypothetical protein
LIVLGVAGAFLFLQSFEKWGDPIADLGRDLYVPSRLLEGAHLYRDVIYNYGPLAPLSLAAIVRAFGDGLPVFEAFGIAIGLGTLWAIYALGALVGNRAIAFAASLLFLTFSFFARSTFGCNFVLPYSYAATLATMCALWSLYFLIASTRTGAGRADRWLGAACLCAALLAKSEVGAAILAVHVLAWIAYRPGWRFVGAVGGIGLGIGAACLAAFYARSPQEHAFLRDNIARFVGNDAAAPFFSSVSGAYFGDDRLWEYVSACAEVLALGLLAWLAIRWHEQALADRRSWSAAGIAAAAAFAAGVFAWGDVLLFRAVPLAALGALVYCLVADRRNPLLLVSALVLAMAPRIVLSYTPEWYGFYLAIPAYLFVPYVVLYALPHTARTRTWATAALLTVLAAVVYHCEHDMWRDYSAMTSVVSTPKGRMFDEPSGRAEAISAFCDYMQSMPDAARATAVVVPEGVSLNYFTGLRNPTAYYNFIPPEIPTLEEEQRMLAELQKAAPEYVIFIDRDTGEFGRRGFGIDYALDLSAWIRDAYQIEKTFGSREHWAMVLLRRKG